MWVKLLYSFSKLARCQFQVGTRRLGARLQLRNHWMPLHVRWKYHHSSLRTFQRLYTLLFKERRINSPFSRIHSNITKLRGCINSFMGNLTVSEIGLCFLWSFSLSFSLAFSFSSTCYFCNNHFWQFVKSIYKEEKKCCYTCKRSTSLKDFSFCKNKAEKKIFSSWLKAFFVLFVTFNLL